MKCFNSAFGKCDKDGTIQLHWNTYACDKCYKELERDLINIPPIPFIEELLKETKNNEFEIRIKPYTKLACKALKKYKKDLK